MSTEETLFEAEDKMDKAIGVARDELAAIRTGRAHPAMFTKLNAEYYGTPTPLQQLATITIPEPRMVMIAPYDKSAMNSIERAIRESDLGVNPGNDGVSIRVVLPQLTEERRREFVKIARSKAEESRVTVRGIRRNAKDEFDRLVKDGEVGEDDVARAEKTLEALTKKHVDGVDDLLRNKEAELLER
jgi:ribosome recycling factor